MNRQFSPNKQMKRYRESLCGLQLFFLLALFWNGSGKVFGKDQRESAWEVIESYFSPPKGWAGKYGDYVSPLRFKDGSMVKTVEDWARRREKIKKDNLKKK